MKTQAIAGEVKYNLFDMSTDEIRLFANALICYSTHTIYLPLEERKNIEEYARRLELLLENKFKR